MYFNAFPFLVLAIPGYKIKIVGCFKEKTKAPHIPERLFSDATGFNSKTKIDYKNFGQYILGAIRRCASAAKAKKYDFFALRKVGECKAVQLMSKSDHPLFSVKLEEMQWILIIKINCRFATPATPSPHF